MNHKNIMNQLTTNLSFRTAVAKPAAAASCKLLLAKNATELPQSDPPANATSLKQPRQADDKINEITILNGITNNVQSKSLLKTKKQVNLKNLAQINKEKVNHLRNLNHININGNDVPDLIENFEQFTRESVWADEKLPDKLVENLLAYKFSEPTPVQMQSMPVMLNVFIH